MPNLLGQTGAGNLLQWTKRGRKLLKKQAVSAKGLKDVLPLTVFAPDAAKNILARGLARLAEGTPARSLAGTESPELQVGE